MSSNQLLAKYFSNEVGNLMPGGKLPLRLKLQLIAFTYVLICTFPMCFFYGLFPVNIRIVLSPLYLIFVAFGWKNLRTTEKLYSKKKSSGHEH